MFLSLSACICVYLRSKSFQNAFDVPLQRNALDGIAIADHGDRHRADTASDEAENVHGRLARRQQARHGEHGVARANAIDYSAGERRNLAETLVAVVA